MDSTTGSDLINIDTGGGDPPDEEAETPLLDRLDEVAANQAATRQAVEQLAAQEGAQIDDPRSTYPYTLRATVPPLTSPVDPLEASFETPYDGTIVLAIPRFPNGVQDTTGIALYGPQESKLLPRGGEYNFAADDGSRETGEVKYLTGNNTTYPPIDLNVDAAKGQDIVAEFANSDPENEHLVSIDIYYREREV